MSLGRYLPSAQFALIISSIAISGGLVYAAQYFTGAPTPPQLASAPTPVVPADTGWQDTLAAIQGGTPAVGAPDQDAVANLLKAAKSTNLTDTVARTLLINLSDAKAQGLGGDIPTQDKLVAQAAAQVNQGRGAPSYTLQSLATVAQTNDSLKAYGNSVINVLVQHTGANYDNTMLAIGQALQNSDTAKLATLVAIQKDYTALAGELAGVPVPETLAPLHLAVVNNVANIAATYTDMRALFDDPLRALAALQQYQSLSDETQRLFINIAQALSQRGILFTKDEPGSAWSAFLQSQ